jgi:translation initiation factor IF-2
MQQGGAAAPGTSPASSMAPAPAPGTSLPHGMVPAGQMGGMPSGQIGGMPGGPHMQVRGPGQAPSAAALPRGAEAAHMPCRAAPVPTTSCCTRPTLREHRPPDRPTSQAFPFFGQQPGFLPLGGGLPPPGQPAGHQQPGLPMGLPFGADMPAYGGMPGAQLPLHPGQQLPGAPAAAPGSPPRPAPGPAADAQQQQEQKQPGVAQAAAPPPSDVLAGGGGGQQQQQQQQQPGGAPRGYGPARGGYQAGRGPAPAPGGRANGGRGPAADGGRGGRGGGPGRAAGYTVEFTRPSNGVLQGRGGSRAPSRGGGRGGGGGGGGPGSLNPGAVSFPSTAGGLL